MQCAAEPLGGGQCELESGHEGKHRKTLYRWDGRGPSAKGTPVGVYEWDDASVARAIKQWEGRLD